MSGADKVLRRRLKSLEKQLKKETPILVRVVQGYRQLDRVARSLGLLGRDESFATQISWWPMISVLGTFSAGKSSFINHYLGESIQSTGNQAVDDKFTVMCFGGDRGTQTLPGSALDADPRFPFYRISDELEKVASGEGRRVDSYLQVKTVACEKLRGSIIIDSPGFDADSQRDATLRLTDHIVDISDLVLVFFDARHPEPGAMRDTLSHLVGDTIHRPDAAKFIFILNQMDTAARDDNPEEVVGSWQRALAQEGLTAGRFYCIYNPDVAVAIEDDSVRSRYEMKRDRDLGEIHDRIQSVAVERAYRIIGALGKLALQIEEKTLPRLASLRSRWRKRVLWGDAFVVTGFLGVVYAAARGMGLFEGVVPELPQWPADPEGARLALLLLLGSGGVLAYLHFRVRRYAAGRVLKYIDRQFPPGSERERLRKAFVFNTRNRYSVLGKKPVGWGKRSQGRLRQIIEEANRFVQNLNDEYTDPSGVIPKGSKLNPFRRKSTRMEEGKDAPHTEDH